MNAYKNASYVGFVIMIFGVIISVYGFSFLLKQNNLVANGITVKGKVVEMGTNGPMYVHPIVTFKTQEGEELTFKSELDLNMDITPYYVGKEVNVIYNKDNPQEAKIDNFLEANFAQIFLGVFGVFLVILGLFLRWNFLRLAKKYSPQ